MWQSTDTRSHEFDDVRRLIERLNRIDDSGDRALRDLFDPRIELSVARAPGRLDVMGGIADYSGSLVLEMPIAEAACVAAQRGDDGWVRVVAFGDEDGDADRGAAARARGGGAFEPGGKVFEAPIEALMPGGEPPPLEQARAYFAAGGAGADQHWAAYVAGTAVVLAHELGWRCGGGLRLLLHSDVPAGKGVSSSAAIEVAAMTALAGAFGLKVGARETALWCQRVENEVVGAPCGVMDQMTSARGRANTLLRLLCQPAELLGHTLLPDGVALWGIDSGIRHAVSGSDYGSVRVGAFMGRRIIFDLAGEEQYGGYLANVTPEEFDDRFAEAIPESMRGGEFLERYGETGDPVTRVDPDAEYAVRQPTRHPIDEHARVRRFADLLEQGACGGAAMAELGGLMVGSHQSYSSCGLGSDGTDDLVRRVLDVGPSGGLYGAKITGGGSGGAVAVLGRPDAEPAVRRIADAYAADTGRDARLFAGSSPGARAFGCLTLAPVR